MSSTPISSLDVGMAGLDLLPQTRLKVACSLMAAERMDLRPSVWAGGPCALVVADEASPLGRDAIARALATRTPLIRLGDPPRDALPGPVVSRKSTVREFVDALRAGLAAMSSGDSAETLRQPLPPLLDQLRRDQPGKARMLLEHGLVRVVVAADTRQLHMLRRVPLDDLLERALRQDWSVTELDDATWRSGYEGDIAATHSIESVWWRIAPILPADMLGVEFQGIQMLAWPDLDPGTVDASWILPMACLQLREWRPLELAAATQVPLKDIRKIMAAARYAGLAGRPAAGPAAMLPRRSPASQALAVFKIARRFGMRLLGVVNG